MAQQVKAIAATPEKLSCIPRTHGVGEVLGLGVWVGLTGHSPAEEAVARWIPGPTPCSHRGSGIA